MFVSGQIQVAEPEPEFLAPLENLTVTQGRDVFFTCVVNHLGAYKVSKFKQHDFTHFEKLLFIIKPQKPMFELNRLK